MAGYTAITRRAVNKCVFAGMLIATIASSAVASAADAAAAGEAPGCGVMYANADKPLLFGGVHGGCTGRSCQPRDDEWSEKCDYSKPSHPRRGHSTCTDEQKKAVYEQLQKQPDAEEMWRFTPCTLYKYLMGRTLWVTGDSIMRNFYVGLRCFMLDHWDHSRGECAANPDTRGQRAIYRAADTNITSSKGVNTITDMPKCFYLLGGGRICWVQSVRGEEYAADNEQNPGLMQVLQHNDAKRDDIFFMNFGRWHYTNCDGLQAGPFRDALNALGSLYKRTKENFPYMIYKTISADHTACKPAAGLPAAKIQCLPIGQGSYPPSLGQEIASISQQILGRYGMPVLETFNVTKFMNLGHIQQFKGGVKDCTHYCNPGVPEWEIWSMYKLLRKMGVTPITSQADIQVFPACTPQTEYRPPQGWSWFYDEVNWGNRSRLPTSELHLQEMQPADGDLALAD